MLIYVDNKKINVNKLESIYIINQKFGKGIIKYNGITLSPKNNFAFYGIKNNSHLSLHGLKGGNLDSETVKKDAKIAVGLYLNIIIGIYLFYLFIFSVGSGIYTTFVEFLFVFIRDIISGQLLHTKICKGSGNIGLLKEKFSHKILKVMLLIIFVLFSIVLIYYSIYIFANLVSIIFLSTSKKILNYITGREEDEKELLCDSIKNASWVGKITAMVYTIIYYILRAPNGLIEFIENRAPFEIKIFNPILNAIDVSISAIKDAIVLSIPVLGEVIDGYIGAIGSIIETIWNISRLMKDELGNPLNNYLFSCNNINSVSKFYELCLSIVTGEGPNVELQEIFTDARFMPWFKSLLGFSANKIQSNPELLKKFRDKIAVNGQEVDNLRQYSEKYNQFVKGRPLRKFIINKLFVIICQLLSFGNMLGIKVLEFSPTFEKPLDMISDGLYSGMITVIVFIITLIVLFIKNLF